MKILSVIRTLDPEYGGPVEAATSIKNCFSSSFSYAICSFDSVDSPWMSKFDNSVTAIGDNLTKYGYNLSIRRKLRDLIKLSDVVIVHGIWQYQSYVTRLLCAELKKPYVILVHGALDPWFKRRYPFKHLKKVIYWLLVERINFINARAVVYTDNNELFLAKNSFPLYKAINKVFKYGIIDRYISYSKNDLEDNLLLKFPELTGKRVCLFLSRIDPKKGCDILIEAFSSVAINDKSLHLVIAGPDSVSWKEELIILSIKLGISDRITWTGMITGALKSQMYAFSEIFLLPSHSENFGLVIAEALSFSLPVLITDKVNIHHIIEKDCSGLVSSDDITGFKKIMLLWFSFDAILIAEYKNNARKCFDDNFNLNYNIVDLEKLLINI